MARGWLAQGTTARASRTLGCREKTSRHQGVVKLVDRSKGFGFIQCDEVHERYGSDVFVRVWDLQEHAVGDSVCFSLSEGNRGQPQGTELKLCTGYDQELTEGDNDNNASGIVGTIKSYNEEHGYGFISCAKTFAKYGRDVYVHKDQLLQFKVGQQVSCSVKTNPAGHPQASNLTEVQIPVELLGDDGQLDAAGKSDTLNVNEKYVGTDTLHVNDKYVGTVKNINGLKSCGFIECQVIHTQFGRDVFFPLALLPGLSNGDQVEFQARVRNSQPQAYNVTRLSTPPRPAAQIDRQKAAPDSAELTKKLLRACASARKDAYSRMFELLHAGADPNGRDITGQRALMVCGVNVAESEKKCRLLVGMGADVHATYTGDLTVLQWARQRLSNKFAEHLAALSRGEQIDCVISLDFMGGAEV